MTLQPTQLPNTFVVPGRYPRIVTKNLTPGKTFFENEERWYEGETEYRILDPRHSKLGAAIAKGCSQYGLTTGCRVLYLGASHGYTSSYVSDMVGPDGAVFCLDVAPRVVRDLVFVCEARANMTPLLADANDPMSFAPYITGVDVVFQDIAQRQQVDIFLKNVMAFVRPGGVGMLAVKARSVDVTRKPADIFKEVKRRLDTTPGISLIDYRDLDPFEKDHAFFVVKRR